MALRAQRFSATVFQNCTFVSSTTHRHILALQHQVKRIQQQQRSITTCTVDPPVFVEGDTSYCERPGTFVLAESPLWCRRHFSNGKGKGKGDGEGLMQSTEEYSSSWSTKFASLVPRRGMAFANVDIFSCVSSSSEDGSRKMHALSRLEKELATDIGTMPPGTVLVAVGPVPCLVAQYYLESLPLAGLVLVDPMVLPPLLDEDSSARSTIESAIEVLKTMPKSNNGSNGNEVVEQSIVEDLASHCSSWDRPLRLEPGSVPMLILLSKERSKNKSIDGNSTTHAFVHRTASIHSIYDDEKDVPVKRIEVGRYDEVLDEIFNFIDESVQ